MRLIDMVLCVVCSVAFSIALSASLSLKFVQPVKTIDLGKIISAQNMLTIKASQSGDETSKVAWLKTAKDAGMHLKAVIRQVAGPKAIVLVSQAVVDPKDDITKQVLLKLGLPSNVPDLIPPQGAITGRTSTLTSIHKAGLPSFLTP